MRMFGRVKRPAFLTAYHAKRWSANGSVPHRTASSPKRFSISFHRYSLRLALLSWRASLVRSGR